MAAVFTTGLNCAWDAIRSNAIRLILIFWFVMDTVHWAEKLFTVVNTNHQLSPFKWKLWYPVGLSYTICTNLLMIVNVRKLCDTKWKENEIFSKFEKSWKWKRWSSANASQDLFTNPYPTPGPTAPVQLATVTQQSLQISTKHHQCIAMQLRVAQTTRPTHATLTVQCNAMFSDTLRCIFKQCFYTLLKIVCFMYLKAILGYILGWTNRPLS